MAANSFVNLKSTMDYPEGAGSDDEDSFVVLPITSPEEEVPEPREEILAPLRTNKIHDMQNLLKLSIAQIEQIPEMPSAVNPLDAVASSITKLTISPDSSYEEIQKQVEELIKENETLKNTIAQNNMSMKSQYEKFLTYKDDVTNVMKSYKDKFNEAKLCISKFKDENAQLASELDVYMNIKKLHEEEIIGLKDQIRALKVNDVDNKNENDSGAEFPQSRVKLEELHLQNQASAAEIDSLKRNFEECKTELNEIKARNVILTEENKTLKVIADTIKKLETQLSLKNNEVEKLSENLVALHKNQVLPLEQENVRKLQQQLSEKEDENEKLTEKLVNIHKLEDHIQTQKQEINVLQFDISANKAEISKLRHDNQDLQKQNEALLQQIGENVNSKDKEIVNLKHQLQMAYTVQASQQTEISQLKEKLKSYMLYSNLEEEHKQTKRQLCQAQKTITAIEAEREVQMTEIENLRKIIQQTHAKTDEIFALQQQLEVYKNDFEAEKESKATMKREKDQIADDLKNVQNRNKQLQNEIETLRARHQPKPEGYSCPKCSFAFNSYQSLENHVHRCLDLDSLP